MIFFKTSSFHDCLDAERYKQETGISSDQKGSKTAMEFQGAR